MITQYRLLEKGETIQEGDEYFCIQNRHWTKIVNTIGMHICSKDYPHRRPIKGHIIDLPAIDGYEYTGEYRIPLSWEPYLNSLYTQPTVTEECNPPRKISFILRKIEKPKTYRPFKDYDEMKPHRERMVLERLTKTSIPLWFVDVAYRAMTYERLREDFVFEDTVEPVGVMQ